MRFSLGALAALLLSVPASGQGSAPPLRIVAAENFYGDVAQQLAGPHAKVTSILSSPDEDPHLFEASPSVARDLTVAQIVVVNGADYDPWMTKLLGAARTSGRKAIVVAELVRRKPGDNPHLWYDPVTMPAYAQALSADLAAADPANKAEYEQRLQRFLDTMKPLQLKVSEIRQKHAGTPVAATEPIFGSMATALGLTMRNARFQLAVMNNAEPSASDVAAFEDDLRQHKVKLLIANSQATDSAAQRLLRIANECNVPVLGVTETEPNGTSFQDWMLGQLDALDRMLSSPPP